MQIAHIEFIKFVLTEYSAFKGLSKMSQEHAAPAAIIALISEKTKSRDKTKRE